MWNRVAYEITKQWIEEGSENQRIAFTNINLYIKYNSEWSKAIPGTGGSSFIAKERNGMYTSDECFKMALTDAISVASKALGVGADVYFEKDKTKYISNNQAIFRPQLLRTDQVINLTLAVNVKQTYPKR